MTKLGKYLVLLNVSLSLMFLAWALGLYTNHVHWATPPSTDGQRVQGMVDELKDQTTRLVAARDAADSRWYAGAGQVLSLEAARPANQKFYGDLTRSVRQGNVADIKPPVQQLQFDQFNRLLVKRTGRPAYEIEGQPALSVAGYRKAIQDKSAAITQAQQAVKALIAETEQLTRKINGFDPAGGGERVTADQKGLRAILADQDHLARDLRLEQDFLRSPLTNLTIEAQLLRKRQTALVARMDELRAATAIGRRD